MIALILRRLLWAIPTLAGVLVITFWLNTAATYDPVSEVLSAKAGKANTSRYELDQLYLSTQRQMALDRHPFYWSVRAHYQPANAFDIVPKLYRQNLLKLNKEVRNWETVMAYHREIERVISVGVESVPRYIDELQRANSLDEVRRIAAHNKSVMPDELSIAIADMTRGANKFTYPVFAWHGGRSQFHYWIIHLLDNDLRVSKRDGMPVVSVIANALSWTLALSVPTLVLAILLSLMIGILQVRYEHSWFDRISSQLLYVLYAVPLFWLATMSIVFFTTDDYGSWTNLFPSIGMKYWMRELSGGELLWAKMKQLTLPIIVMTISSITYLSKQVKTDLIRQRSTPYVITALAKGVSRDRLLTHHLLPNALIPLITISTGAIPRTLVGAIVIEVIFAIPGMGKLLIDSIFYADWAVSFSIVLLVGVVTILSYLLADILYAVFYPQLSTELIEKRA